MPRTVCDPMNDDHFTSNDDQLEALKDLVARLEGVIADRIDALEEAAQLDPRVAAADTGALLADDLVDHPASDIELPDDTVPFWIALPPSVARQLKAFAANNGLDAAQVVIGALEHALTPPATATRTE